MTTPSYISIADIQEYWRNTIAPNYFDFENVNNYKAGMFGYINEIMANTTEDTHNAINIARREFYPITAKNKQSFYKMATIQKLGLPMTTPSTCKAFLIIPQDEIISKSTLSNGVYTCVIDNTMKLLVGDIPFMLDYPIVIVSKKVGNAYNHTSHYDVKVSNSLSSTSSKYIMNLVISSNGIKYLSLGVTMRQVEMESISKLITKDTNIDVVSIDFPFDGNISNFEVYYSADGGNVELQLTKLLYGASALNAPFVYYTMVDDNTIRLTFPKNPYFTPAFNSEIRMEVYTSKGEGGDFDSFKGDLIAQISSEKYPYNNTMTITGKVNGSASGGIDKKTDNQFQQEIIKAYSTNNTITTSNDLQLYFNDLGASPRNKILFRKKRDDSLYRIFGAYSLLKDTSDNVVPTNTVDLSIQLSDFDLYTTIAQRAILAPGTLFEYVADPGDGTISYSVKKITDLTLNDDLSAYDDNSRFIFTNPFLMAVTFDPNVVGFYLNSIDNSFPIEYAYVNDETYIQFIGSALSVKRNSMFGENYYKLSINITSSTDIDISKVATINDPTNESNIIRATMAGKVVSSKYVTDHIVVTIKYTDNSTAEIITSSYITYNAAVFTYNTGYNMKFNVGDSFVANDILATKKDTDLGKLRVMGDMDKVLTDNDLYFPFVLEAIDANTGIFTFCAYLSTNDYMTLESKMLIQNGILNRDGTPNADVSVPMGNISFKISTFYKNDDMNYSHIYSGYPFFMNYTMTNTYLVSDNISLIQQIDFIRSTLTYVEGEIPGEFSLSISEVPVAKANWIKHTDNFKYLVNIVKSNYASLSVAYYLLENNFGIDLKFFNTYGKSRFYKVGIKDTSQILDSVNCSFSFGVALSSLTSSDIFIEKFRTFVKEYIESLNDVNSMGQSIYIMNLIASIKEEFSEISYLEYYGMNSYSHEVQKIESLTESELSSSEVKAFIPEFINVYSYNDGTINIPKIDVILLD